MGGISWGGVLARIVLAIALVLLTFNPSHSFYHWVSAPLLGKFVWMLLDLNALQLADSAALVWIARVVLSIVLGIGLAWALSARGRTSLIEPASLALKDAPAASADGAPPIARRR